MSTQTMHQKMGFLFCKKAKSGRFFSRFSYSKPASDHDAGASGIPPMLR
jgi:hypothetical protein